MQPNSRIPHHRAPRHWPALRTEPFALPYPAPQSPPPPTTLLVTAASLVGITLSVFLLRSNGGSAGGLGIGLLAVSGSTAIASILTYFMQRRTVRRDNHELLRQYVVALNMVDGPKPDGTPGELPLASATEATFRRENDPPLSNPDPVGPQAMTLVHSVQQDPSVRLWPRRPTDPDFLTVRVGMGRIRPIVHATLPDQATGIALPAKHKGFRAQHGRAKSIVERYEWMDRVPITVPLREHSGVAVVTGNAYMPTAEAAASAMIAQVALRHSPFDVHICALHAPKAASRWGWVQGLAAGVSALPTVLGSDPLQRARALDLLYSELSRREQVLSTHGSGSDQEHPPTLPHLVLVVDALNVDSPADDPTDNPVVRLALRRGKELGVTVLSLNHRLAGAPSGCTLAIDVSQKQVIPLWPSPPAIVQCETLDTAGPAECANVSQLIYQYLPQKEDEQTLPTSVLLLSLVTPPISSPARYDPTVIWEHSRQQAQEARMRGVRSCTIPVGVTASDQPLSLDFVSDGPHGLLIGQTGSGKSELLRSIIAALAITYPPDMVNFVLVDYKGGLGLEVFEHLPHTLALLTNLERAGQTNRFLTMLESEMLARQEKMKAGQPQPRLFVIIDEFAEMVARRGPNDASDAILENLLRIVRLGRQLDVHLLFASQRPEGSVIAKLRGYVQYRFCLRTNTEEDSKEILGRPDAAYLSIATPGRGYLLRGDNALTLFQTALISERGNKRAGDSAEAPRDVDDVIAERIRGAPRTDSVVRWPDALPAPTTQRPTPLILAAVGKYSQTMTAWNVEQRLPLKPMVAPIGLFDRPSQRARDWFKVDLLGHEGRLHGGPLLIMGDLNAGKTTTLQTILLYFAQNYSPADLRWYIVDPTGAFEEFAALPHARDYRDQTAQNVVEGDEKDFPAFKARFEQAMALAPQSGRPPLLLIIDDYDDVAARFGAAKRPLLHELTQKVIRGRKENVFLAISAARQGFDTLPTPIFSAMATKIVLYMSNRDNLSAALGARLPFVPDPLPGRGFAQTRVSLDEIQVASPVYGVNDAERADNLHAALQSANVRVPAR